MQRRKLKETVQIQAHKHESENDFWAHFRNTYYRGPLFFYRKEKIIYYNICKYISQYA